VTSISSNSTVS